MITFNTVYRKNDSESFGTVFEWLGALYTANKLTGIEENEIAINSLIDLQNKIHYQFKNSQLLITSLTHKTFQLENKNLIKDNNEKLEFLGDSVLNLIISDYLFKNFPELDEGQLSKFRVTLVNEESFARLARYLKLNENLFIGRGEFKNNGINKDSLLADAFEALFGALSLECSLEELKNIFQKIVIDYDLSNQSNFFDLVGSLDFDSKTKLQELVVEKYGLSPMYKFREIENGFDVELWIGDKLIGNKTGISKKKAEKELAKTALENNLI